MLVKSSMVLVRRKLAVTRTCVDYAFIVSPYSSVSAVKLREDIFITTGGEEVGDFVEPGDMEELDVSVIHE
jgi:hypothetical protein